MKSSVSSDVGRLVNRQARHFGVDAAIFGPVTFMQNVVALIGHYVTNEKMQ